MTTVVSVLCVVVTCAERDAGLVDKSPFSWIAYSANGKYVFVGVSGYTVDEQIQMLNDPDMDQREREEKIARIRRIQSSFPVTGLYSNDGSNVPLWTLREWEGGGRVSSNGKNLVVIGEGAYGNDSQSCIARIYDKNGLVRRLNEFDLVSNLELWIRQTFSDSYVSFNRFALDDSGENLIVMTNFGDRIVIRLADGRVVSATAISKTISIVQTTFLIVIAGLIGLYLAKARRKIVRTSSASPISPLTAQKPAQ